MSEAEKTSMGIYSGPSRENARTMMETRINRLREEAFQLESLLRECPMHLTPSADEALFKLLMRRD